MFFLSVLAVCGTFVWAVREAKPFLVRRLNLSEREIGLHERELELKDKEISRPAPTKQETPPEDLMALAMGQQEAWAREDALKRLYELYELTKDWGAVRNAFDFEMSR